MDDSELLTHSFLMEEFRVHDSLSFCAIPASKAELFLPRHGDLVVYRGDLYFFQPNGSWCYLYRQRADVGYKDKVAHSVFRESISRPSAAQYATLNPVVVTTSPPNPLYVLADIFEREERLTQMKGQ